MEFKKLLKIRRTSSGMDELWEEEKTSSKTSPKSAENTTIPEGIFSLDLRSDGYLLCEFENQDAEE